MIETSFIKWINSFKDLSGYIEDLSELSDGLILNEICCQITPKYFDTESIRKDGLDNWIFKEENIKSIVEKIDEFYREEMGLNEQLSLTIDTEKIANGNIDELSKLIESVLGMATECENNQLVIENILGLDQDTQNDLMVVVEKIQLSHQEQLGTVENSKTFDGEDQSISQSPPKHSNIDINSNSSRKHIEDNINNSSNNSSVINNLQNEIDRLKREKEEIENDLQESNIQLSNVTMDRDRITMDKQKTEEVCSQLHESIIGLQKQLDETMAQTTTMNALNDETYKNEINDLHMQVETKDKQLSDLKKKVDEANRLANDNRSLRDEIDILREKASHAEETEEKLKKHQKRIEEIADLKKKIKELEEQNDNYIQQTLDLEEQLSKNNTYRNQADSGKQQISSLKIEVTKLELSLKSVKEDRDKLNEELSAIELERNSLQSQVSNLRSTIDNQQQEYESKFVDLQSSIALNSASSNDGTGGLGGEVIDSSTKERIARLERDNKRLKEVAEKASELENQLEDANQSKELLTIQIKQLEEQQGNNSNNNSNNNIDSITASEIEALKLQLKEKDKEILTLKRKLEESNLSLDEIKKQLVELSQRPTASAPEDIEKLVNYDVLVKENDGLEGRLRAARNIIKDLREKHKGFSNQETQLQTKDEIISKLESVVKKKTDINEDLRKQLEEGREESQREITLMLSAFLKIGLEMEQVKIQNISKFEPKSYLSMRRDKD